jgi:hypothetical protein
MYTNPDTVDWAAYGTPEVADALRLLQAEDTSNTPQEIKLIRKLHELVIPEDITDMQDWGGPARMMETDFQHRVVPFLIEILAHSRTPSIRYLMTVILRETTAYWKVAGWVASPGHPRRLAYIAWAEHLRDIMRRSIPVFQILREDDRLYTKDNLDHILDSIENHVSE